jgi:hypothetical protein
LWKKNMWKRLMNSKTTSTNRWAFFVTLTQHISYLEAELKRTSLVVDKMSIQRELCPSNLLLNFLVNEYLTGWTNLNNLIYNRKGWNINVWTWTISIQHCNIWLRWLPGIQAKDIQHNQDIILIFYLLSRKFTLSFLNITYK